MWFLFERLTSRCNIGVDLGVHSFPTKLIRKINTMKDNAGRRFVIDRRRYTNLDYFPERRTLRFRRSDLDRRQKQAGNIRYGIERRTGFR